MELLPEIKKDDYLTEYQLLLRFHEESIAQESLLYQKSYSIGLDKKSMNDLAKQMNAQEKITKDLEKRCDNYELYLKENNIKYQ